MATGQHKATLEIDARVAGAEKALSAMSKKVGKLEKQLNKTGKAGEKAGQAITSAIAGFASVQGIRQLDELVQHSIKYENVMANLPFSIDKARKSTEGLVSDFDLAKSAVAATSLGVVKTEEDFAKLSRSAIALGSKLGIDTPQAMEQLTLAVGRGSRKILDNFGIIVEGFETMSMEERLAVIEDAMDGTTFAVNENAQAWMRLKNDLDNIKNDSLPIVIKLAGDLAGDIKEITDGMKGVAFDARAKDWAAALGKVWKVNNDIMLQMVPLGSQLEDLGEELFGTDGDASSYKTTLDRVAEATGRNIQATDTWMQKLRRMRGEIPDVNTLMAVALIQGSGKMAGRDAGILGAHKGAMGALAKGTKRKGGRKGGKKGDFLDQFKSDSFTETGAADSFKQELIDEETQLIERQIEVMNLQREIASQGATTETEIHQIKLQALEETFEAEMRIAEVRGDEHQQQVLRLQMQMEMANEQARHSEVLAKQEAKRQADRLKRQQQILSATQQVGDGLIQTASAVTNAMGLEGEKQAKAEGIIQGTRALFIGGLEMVKAVSSFAGFNYIEGAAHVAAATFAFIQGGLMIAGTPPRGGGGSAPRPDTGVGASGGFGGASYAGGGGGTTRPSGGGGGGGNSPIPGSPNGVPPGGTQGGGNQPAQPAPTINYLHIGRLDREGATTIRQGLEELDHSSGRVRA